MTEWRGMDACCSCNHADNQF